MKKTDFTACIRDEMKGKSPEAYRVGMFALAAFVPPNDRVDYRTLIEEGLIVSFPCLFSKTERMR
jgi:hypothetical protein